MTSVLLKNVNAVLPNETRSDTSILIDSGEIAWISSTDTPTKADEILDLSNSFVYPGFIDIHTHGAVGEDINRSSGNSLRTISQFLLSKGVTAWLPTLVPDSGEVYASTISTIDKVMGGQHKTALSQILGVHYEGVFANEKMCGALRPEFFREFRRGKDIDDLPIPESGVRFATVAPEIENGIRLTEELKKRNWIVAIGHSRADKATLDRAFDAGARHLTHFFNAMTGLHHRKPGVVGWGLANQGATFDIIADGVHVDKEILRLAVNAKGTEDVTLISDSISPTGLGDGDYEVWGDKITVAEGKTLNSKGSIAGSVSTMLDAVKMMVSLGYDNVDIAKMAAANPAKLLGLYDERGSIEVGKRADLVAVDGSGEVRMAMVGGNIGMRE